MCITAAQPKISHHFYIGYKGHYWMMRLSTTLFRVVTCCRTLLITIPCNDGRIQIQCEVVKGQLIEKPLIQKGENICIVLHRKLLEIAYKSPASSHLFPAKHLLYYAIKTSYFQVLIPACTTPNRYHKLNNKLYWIISTVRSLQRQRTIF